MPDADSDVCRGRAVALPMGNVAHAPGPDLSNAATECVSPPCERRLMPLCERGVHLRDGIALALHEMVRRRLRARAAGTFAAILDIHDVASRRKVLIEQRTRTLA